MINRAFGFEIWVFIFLFASFSRTTVASPGRAYYLSSAGNDANRGTSSSPWKTINRVNQVKLREGDSIIFAAGETFYGTLEISNAKTATPKFPIVVGSSGKSKATLNGGNGSGIAIKNSSYINIVNLSLTGSGRKNGNIRDGLRVDSSSYLVLSNLHVSGFQKAGVHIYASSHIDLKEINASDNGFAGIFISGPYGQRSSRDITLSKCIASNNAGDPTELDNHSGNGILAGYCKNILIDRCKAFNNGWDMPRKGNGPVGIWCYEADSVTIQYCLSYKNKTSPGGEDGGGFDLDGGTTNSVIQYCVSYQNAGSGFGIFQYKDATEWNNNTVRYNISYNDGEVSPAKAGVYIWSSSDKDSDFTRLIFHGNAIVSDHGAAIHFARTANNRSFIFYNNLFVAGDAFIIGNDNHSLFAKNAWLASRGFHQLFDLSNRFE